MAAPSVSSVSTETRLCVLLVRVVTAAWAGVALQLALSWPSLAQVQLQEEVLPILATSARLAAALSLLVFIIGEVTGNVSSVDRDHQTSTGVFLKRQTCNKSPAWVLLFTSFTPNPKFVSRM